MAEGWIPTSRAKRTDRIRRLGALLLVAAVAVPIVSVVGAAAFPGGPAPALGPRGSDSSIVPRVSVEADPTLGLSESSGPVGDLVTATGSGFAATSQISFTFADVPTSFLFCSDGALSVGVVTTDPSGGFACSLSVPSGTSGTLVVAEDASSGIGTASYNVTVPTVLLSASSGNGGDPITISGSGFSSSDTTLTVTSAPTGAVSSPSCMASDQVITSCSFVVNAGALAVQYAIVVTGLGGNDYARALFTVSSGGTGSATLGLSESSGPVGDPVTATGSGFAASSAITFTFGGVSMSFGFCTVGTVSAGVAHTDPSGAFSCSTSVPSGTLGTTVAAEDASSTFGISTYAVTIPAVTLYPAREVRGQTVTITGGGFSSADTSLTVTSFPSGGVVSPSCSVSDQVITGCSFTASGPLGSYIVSVTGSGGSQDFTRAAFEVYHPISKFSVTFQESGLPTKKLTKAGWTVVFNGTRQHSTSGTITFTGITEVINGTYPALVTGPKGYAATASGTVAVSGATTVPVTISKAHTVTLTFREKGVPAGDSWCVSIDGYEQCTTSPRVKYLNLSLGTYDYSVITPAANVTVALGRTSEPTAGSITLSKSASLKVTYVPTYLAVFTESGSYVGTWTVTIKGVSQSAPTGSPITFRLGNGTYHYSIGAEAGFHASGSPTKLTVSGPGASVSVTFTARTGPAAA
jgi:hypothetical protein